MATDFSGLQKFILEKMSEHKIPGLSITVIQDNESVYARALGFRDIASGLPATPRTLYGIGSVTKSFTALAIMQLVEEGSISLDDPIEKYVDLKLRPFDQTVKIYHILTHSSGLPALAYAEAFIRGVLGIDQNWLPLATPDDVIGFMKDANEWAVSKPGERFFYLNEGYVILGHIISKITGLRYEDYVKKRIFDPLKMHRTFFSRSDFENDGDRATGYIIDKDQKHIMSGFPYGVTSDGGIISNVVDLSNYVRMYLQRGEFNEERVVSGKMLEEMEKPHVVRPYEQFGKEAYGYGWGVSTNFLGHKLVGHGGSVGTYTAYVGYVPDKKIGVAFLANPSQYPMANFGRYALALSLGEDPERLPFVRHDRTLTKLQGEYKAYKGTIKVTIKKRGDFLSAEFRDKYREEIVPLIPDRLDDNEALFFTLAGGIKQTAEFAVKADKVQLIYERYKFVKAS